MFENFGEIAKLMQRAKELKGNLASMRQELASAQYPFCSADGTVQVVASGDFQIRSIVIAPGAPAGDALSNTVLEAVNGALALARADMQKRMSDLTGGLNLPDLF